MSNMKESAKKLFNQGYSCSESIIRAAYEAGIIDKNIDIELITKMATPFSGGMSSGCLCGAVAGGQMVLGLIHGRTDINSSPAEAKAIAKKFIDTFKEQRKATCCKVLTAKYDFHSTDRREHCAGIVQEVAEILDSTM